MRQLHLHRRNGKVGATVITKDRSVKIHLPKPNTIYSVEAIVIEKALEEIQKSNVVNGKYAICPDSLSILHSMTKLYIKNTIIQIIHDLHTTLTERNNKTVFIWVA